jgi:hypothetical protein
MSTDWSHVVQAREINKTDLVMHMK